MAEFLSLCDVLFCIISLISYFCNLVFDLTWTYTLFQRGSQYFGFALFFCLFSLILCQIVSFRWYRKKCTRDLLESGDQDKDMAKAPLDPPEPNYSLLVLVCHIGLSGVFWRYSKLFIPVDLQTVKQEFRDLAILRVVHAFCQAAPMLLLQLNFFVTLQNEAAISDLETIGEQVLPTIVLNDPTNIRHQEKALRDLNVVSAILSLCTVAWALASFSKYVRMRSVHRLVLTWLGVIFQVSFRERFQLVRRPETRNFIYSSFSGDLAL